MASVGAQLSNFIFSRIKEGDGRGIRCRARTVMDIEAGFAS
jgi:hypothetical protein